MIDPSANSPSLSLEAFQDIIDRFGENSDQWPESQRNDAIALLDASPAARAIVGEAMQIRTLLKRREVKAPGRLLQAINDRLSAVPEPMRGAQRVRAF